MACCGQNRASLKASYAAPNPLQQTSTHAASTYTTSAHATASLAAATCVRYLNGGTVVVRGPKTGWQYDFSPAHPVQAVEPRDAELFLATGMFERVRGECRGGQG